MTRRAVYLALLAVSTGTPFAQNPPRATRDAAASAATTGSIATQAAPTVPIDAIKLLAPGTGWVSVYRRLLMTTDNGEHWRDITPLPARPPFAANDDAPASIFFLNPRSGWVLYAHTEQTEEGDLWSTFYIESTHDAGRTWKRFDLPKSDCDPKTSSACPNGGGELTFADQQHGWITLVRGPNTAFGGCDLLYTFDGGKTWKPVVAGTDGFIDSMNAADPSTLWMTTSGDVKHAFGVTRDRGATFQPVTLPVPAGIPSSQFTRYQTPTFATPRIGYETVWYSDVTGDEWTGVLFATRNGGRTWKPDRVLSGVKNGSVPSEVVGGIWIVPLTRHSDAYPELIELRAHEKMAAPEGVTGSSRCAVSFVSAMVGWSNCSGQLYSTTDRDATWKDIAPKMSDLNRPR